MVQRQNRISPNTTINVQNGQATGKITSEVKLGLTPVSMEHTEGSRANQEIPVNNKCQNLMAIMVNINGKLLRISCSWLQKHGTLIGWDI